ncbi:MAG: hypothetical protein MUC36_16280 [Planctomycetes bacterium]|jgi:CxxC motif-containing protein (DUF1111 family)|nr:hypothetical protein [Planctomycetota bacterium]
MASLALGSLPLLSLGLAGAAVVLLLQAAEDPAVTRGRELFDRSFHRADGLGTPEMNGDSCRACHSDPVLGGAGALELNVTRFGRDNNGLGPFVELPGGQGLSKLRPPHVTYREEAPMQADCFEQRQPPSLLGIGLIDSIPAAAIVANEDPNDLDGDGIRGVARRLTVQGVIEIGRFGWKAQIPTLHDFSHDALVQELGLTTPDDGRGFAIASDGDDIADPELNAVQVGNLTAFMASLPAPARAGSTDPMVALGQQVFTEIGCAKCHVPTLQGLGGPVPLFSDLLLHNVMAPGYRGMAEPGAGAGMFRTPPLWGIRDTAPYMHDGRAETLTAAILAHDGEAVAVRTNFQLRPQADRDALLRFLGDL